MAERSAFSYIPENQLVNIQSEILEQRRPQERASRGPKKWLQAGTVMIAMLGTGISFIGATKTPGSHKPDVRPQAIVNLLENSSLEDSANPPTNSIPKFWDAPAHSVNVPDPSFDYQNGFYQDGYSSVDTDGYITDTSCSVDTNSWKQSFPAVSSNTYTLSFANYVPLGSSPDLGPRTIITWKNGTTTLGVDDHTFNRISGPDYWESDFSRTYGPGGVAIPAGTTSGELQVGVGSTNTGPCTVGTEGKQYFDVVTVMGPAPTPLGVGGVAHEVDTNSLQQPETTVTHSTRNTIVEIAVAGSVALAGTIVVAEAIRRKRNQS